MVSRYHNWNNNRMKKTFTAEQKATIALVALKGEQTTSQIASVFEVHPTQIGFWKKQALEGLKGVFSDKRKRENKTNDQLIAELYQTIGKRDMELSWLKKKIEPFISSG